MSPQSQRCKKDKRFVGYDSQLDMELFCQQQNGASLNKGGSTYKLFALTEHIGSLDKGHYIACTKRPDGKWYEFNDSVIKKIS